MKKPDKRKAAQQRRRNHDKRRRSTGHVHQRPDQSVAHTKPVFTPMPSDLGAFLAGAMLLSAKADRPSGPLAGSKRGGPAADSER